MAVREEDFLEWTKRPGGPRRPKAITRPKIFYSHWMDDRNIHAKGFLPEFRTLVGSFADVTIGESAGSPPLADFILSQIQESTLAVVQLDPFRPTIGLEIGWCLGNGKPILWAMSDSERLNEVRTWITAFEIQPNGRAEERAQLARSATQLVEALGAGDPSAHWEIGLGGASLREARRTLDSVTLVGSGTELPTLTRRLNDRLLAENYKPALVIDTSDTEVGGLLANTVWEAYRATVALVVLSGDRRSDLLSLIALGAHSCRKQDVKVPVRPRKYRTIPRRALVYGASGPAFDAIPSIVTGMKLALATSDPERAVEETVATFVTSSDRIIA